MKLTRIVGAGLAAWGALSQAQTAVRSGAAAGAPQALPGVEVSAVAEKPIAPQLDTPAAAGSRLGLTARETPASVEVITQETLRQRGAATLEEALRGAVGVTAGGAPGNPSVVSTRGFTGGFVTYLFDGTRISVPSMSSRPQDSFNYDRIEVLKGPASVLFGEGGIGGAVNFVPKRPDRSQSGSEALIAVGALGSLRLGVGSGGVIDTGGAWRLDVSHNRSDGWVDRNRSELSHLTSGVSFEVNPRLKLEASLDLLHDDIASYWGTPLIPRLFAGQPTDVVSTTDDRVVDRRTIATNYNVADGLMQAESAWLRGQVAWQMAPAWTLRNELSAYLADRHWRNAESLTFVAPDRINRDQADISHDHRVLGNRLELGHVGRIVGRDNRFVAGAELQVTDFASERRFSDGSAATNAALQVALLDPQVGRFNPSPGLATGPGNRTDFTTDITVTSLFVEDRLMVVPRLSLVAALRHDRIALDRSVRDLNTGVFTTFGRDYSATSKRIGTVWDIDASTALYAQWGDAVAPVGTANLLLLSAANSNFPLTQGRQIELGVKQSITAARLDWTLALYDIEQDNILSRDPSSPSLTVNNGKIGSRGVELSFGWRLLPELTVSGNLAALKAEFKTLVEAGGVSRVGNLPPNVAERIANLWFDYQAPQQPWGAGLGLRNVGETFTNNANTVRINAVTLVDLYATWRLGTTLLRAGVKNTTDELYATWAGASANNQVMLGAPRTFELSARIAF
jgi:iron complex outermembrane receptor protein